MHKTDSSVGVGGRKIQNGKDAVSPASPPASLPCLPAVGRPQLLQSRPSHPHAHWFSKAGQPGWVDTGSTHPPPSTHGQSTHCCHFSPPVNLVTSQSWIMDSWWTDNDKWKAKQICFVLFRLAIIVQWLQVCPLSLWLCCVGGHFCTCPISYAFLGNKEWPKPKPVQPNIVEWARSICRSVPLMFPLNFFSIKMQMFWCGSKTRVLVLWWFEPNLPQPVKNRVRGSPAGFGAHQVWHRCSVSFPLPRIIIAFLPSCSVSLSSFSSKIV